MNAREQILATVRANTPRQEQVLPQIPAFFDETLLPLPEGFKRNIAILGGVVVDAPKGADIAAIVAQLHPTAAVICSAVPEYAGTIRVEQLTGPADAERIDVSVVRARFGVAETGSVFLSEAELVQNTIGYYSQHLIVLLDASQLIGNLHQAYSRSDFAQARYSVLMTGPSATADIQGVLVRGAQGVRSLTVVMEA